MSTECSQFILIGQEALIRNAETCIGWRVELDMLGLGVQASATSTSAEEDGKNVDKSTTNDLLIWITSVFYFSFEAQLLAQQMGATSLVVSLDLKQLETT